MNKRYYPVDELDTVEDRSPARGRWWWVGDWVHAVVFLVVAPVTAGALLQPWLGLVVASNVFVGVAMLGAFVVVTRRRPAPRAPGRPEESGR